ncbi:ABC transporter permease [Prauserella muralis]|uniref:Peptide ABC transporter permease n=1 Tax=Prauserella muralis TaxID=588067 RepID=A0A2V4AYV7_9PSEU|nr:ABC transporter permease [Prauserella muralis]PXY21100.1 peptide ABC transporter permease [Prauserella muralis]TWE30183.1 peptide/nickel transport system permease protein [Prauserella muralis]
MNLVFYILRRLAISVPILFIGSFLVFLMVAGAGDPLAEIRNQPNINPESIAALSHQLGLDKPLVPRYFDWLGGFLTGDWGISIAQGSAMEPVYPKIMNAFWVTFRLIIGAEILALILGIAVGVLAAVRQYTTIDYVATTLAFLFFSMPIFCVAIILKTYAIDINIVVNQLGWSDVLGNPFLRTTSPESLRADGVGDFVVTYIGAFLLPTLSIMFISFAAYSRFQRSSMLETLNMDYVRTARAKGLSGRRVIFRHAFRNAMIPVTTLFSVNFASVITGAIITERVFNWNGMGTVLVEAVNKNDPNVMMGWVVVIAIAVVLANLVADLLYGILDPRIRVG